jgi:hypothetical protein
MSLSNYLEKKFVDHLTGVASYTAPSTLYLALYSATPSDSGGGTELTSGTAPGYSRQAVTFNAYAASIADKALSSNAPVFTASGGNWPNVTHVGIFDASTAGNLLWYGAMTAAEQINDLGTLTFNAGDITLSLD